MNVTDHLGSANLDSGTLADLDGVALTFANGHPCAIDEGPVAGAEIGQEVFVVPANKTPFVSKDSTVSIFYSFLLELNFGVEFATANVLYEHIMVSLPAHSSTGASD